MKVLISPDPRETLRLHAAAQSLGLLMSWDLPPMADGALSGGVYSDALAELACITSPVMAEVGPLFQRALIELGVDIPPVADAAWMLARRCVESLAHTDRSPRELLGILQDVTDAARDAFPGQRYVGSGTDVEALIGIYWSYDEPGENFYEREQRYIETEEERHAILDREARDAARAWLVRHSG